MKSSVVPIFLAKLNAARQGHFVSLKVEYCGTILRLLTMFHEIGIIRGYQILSKENKIKIMLKYVSGSFNIFEKIVLVSRPGKKVYVTKLNLYKLKEREGGNCIFIISTPFGIIFDSECLIRNIGGEVLLKIII